MKEADQAAFDRLERWKQRGQAGEGRMWYYHSGIEFKRVWLSAVRAKRVSVGGKAATFAAATKDAFRHVERISEHRQQRTAEPNAGNRRACQGKAGSIGG